MLCSIRLLAFLVCIAPLHLLADENEDLPEGNGKETFVQMCSNCHALKRVTKTRYPKKFWESVVDDMVSRGAEGTEEEASIVVSYLSRNFGKAIDINKATAKQIQAILYFSPAQSELIVRYRTDHGNFKSFEDLQKIEGINAKLLDEQKKNILF